MQASVTGLEIPHHRKVQIKLEVAAECNITPFVAKQKVNRFLLLSVGNLLKADEPSLDISPNVLRWRVPVVYALPDRGIVGKVGELYVDADCFSSLWIHLENVANITRSLSANFILLFLRNAPPRILSEFVIIYRHVSESR
ncbi:hypothetical protein HYR99_38895 [Candidatus Poribacteria bacterium]|nr:hypothetical protein [Candidatus Poribacteria bacterium]